MARNEYLDYNRKDLHRTQENGRARDTDSCAVAISVALFKTLIGKSYASQDLSAIINTSWR